jgi:nucleoside-diphosphate-sugar epimerase
VSTKAKAVDKSAVKALVTVYGPNEAARMTGIPRGTIFSWCHRFKWRKAHVNVVGKVRETRSNIAGKDAGDVLRESLENSKTMSTLNLAKFTENASRKAAEHKNPLEVARKVRDVAGVYSTLWPAEEHTELIDGGILLGTQEVTPNLEEIKELSAHVRPELPDA